MAKTRRQNRRSGVRTRKNRNLSRTSGKIRTQRYRVNKRNRANKRTQRNRNTYKRNINTRKGNKRGGGRRTKKMIGGADLAESVYFSPTPVTQDKEKLNLSGLEDPSNNESESRSYLENVDNVLAEAHPPEELIYKIENATSKTCAGPDFKELYTNRLLTREDAEREVEGLGPGKYIIRRSSSPSAYAAVTVRLMDKKTRVKFVKHYSIKKNNKGQYFIDEKNKFCSLRYLLDFFKNHYGWTKHIKI